MPRECASTTLETFRDLGEVGIGKGAACNILSACQMFDTERTFKYDDKNDEFTVSGLGEAYVFTHRLRPDGNKTQFYTRNFAYVATVADNLRAPQLRERSPSDGQGRAARATSRTCDKQDRHQHHQLQRHERTYLRNRRSQLRCREGRFHRRTARQDDKEKINVPGLCACPSSHASPTIF